MSTIKATAVHEMEDPIPTRESLLHRLRDRDDRESWRDFFETYWRLIYNVARKCDLPDAEAQEVVQETIIAVSRNIHRFQYDPRRGSFKNWMLNMTRWRILDRVRKRDREGQHLLPHEDAGSDVSRGTATVDRIPDPNGPDLDTVWGEEWRHNLLEKAIEEVRGRVDARQFQIFHFYVVNKQPVSTVCAMFGVNAGQVYLAKHRVVSLIKKEAKRLEKRMAEGLGSVAGKD